MDRNSFVSGLTITRPTLPAIGERWVLAFTDEEYNERIERVPLDKRESMAKTWAYLRRHGIVILSETIDGWMVRNATGEKPHPMKREWFKGYKRAS